VPLAILRELLELHTKLVQSPFGNISRQFESQFACSFRLILDFYTNIPYATDLFFKFSFIQLFPHKILKIEIASNVTSLDLSNTELINF